MTVVGTATDAGTSTQGRDAHPQIVTRKKVTIFSVDTATRTAIVTWANGTQSEAGIPWDSSYTPLVGDVAFVDRVQGSPMIVGSTRRRGQPASADVTTTSSTTSNTYAAPTTGTVGPAVTVWLTAGQTCLVMIYTRLFNSVNGAGHQAAMSFAVSGASTLASADANAVESQSSTAIPGFKATLFVATGTGNHTFTCQYKTVTAAETATFTNRRIIVTPWL